MHLNEQQLITGLWGGMRPQTQSQGQDDPRGSMDACAPWWNFLATGTGAMQPTRRFGAPVHLFRSEENALLSGVGGEGEGGGGWVMGLSCSSAHLGEANHRLAQPTAGHGTKPSNCITPSNLLHVPAGGRYSIFKGVPITRARLRSPVIQPHTHAGMAQEVLCRGDQVQH